MQLDEDMTSNPKWKKATIVQTSMSQNQHVQVSKTHKKTHIYIHK